MHMYPKEAFFLYLHIFFVWMCVACFLSVAEKMAFSR